MSKGREGYQGVGVDVRFAVVSQKKALSEVVGNKAGWRRGHLEASREDGSEHSGSERDSAELVRRESAGVRTEGVLASVRGTNRNSTSG